MWIVVFIILAFVYFVFIKPIVNPSVKPIPNKICHFYKMASFTQNGEKQPTVGYTEVSFFNHSIVFKGQINEYCKIERIERGLEGNMYCCLTKGNYPIIIGDHFNEQQIHYFISENMGYRLF